MNREADLDRLYEGLSVFARRARELSAELHPGLSLVAFTMLSYIETRPDTRASDIAADWGLDKSTVSRQIDRLVETGLLMRAGERPGRRGHQLQITAEGVQALGAAATSVRALLFDHLAGWSDRDVAAFARLMTRFNQVER